MKRYPLLSHIFPILLLILLLCSPSMSIQGATSGLLLWFNIVLPTLFPFIICTQMVVAFGGVHLLVKPFSKFFHIWFSLSPSGTYILLCGLLCGYPLGAKLCSDFRRSQRISKEEASYLLSICNHPSPMFLLGFVCQQLSTANVAFLLLLCLYLPILPLSLISRKVYKVSLASCVPSETYSTPKNKGSGISMDEIILSTAETMVLIGGYIMLFSIFSVWIQCLWFLPPSITAYLSGIAEITNGVSQLCQTMSPSYKTLGVISIVCFGGLSGLFQTKSVIKNTGLSIRHYCLWKILHTVFACMCFILLNQILRA